MQITFMLFYYAPEKPTINYLYEPLINYYLAKGYVVNIVTPNPTRGLSKEQIHKYKETNVERRGNLYIHRVAAYTYLPAQFSKWRLLRRYISVSRRLARYARRLESNLIFVSTNPPLLYSYLVIRHAKRKKIPVLYNVQDIYPNNVLKRGNPLYIFFNYFQKYSLKHAAEIVTISQTMRDTLLRKGKYADKLSVIYNFDISNVASSRTKENPFFTPNKFNVVYAGNIGYVQDVDVLLAAAKLLLNDPSIAIHIFGEGSQSARISARIKDENIVNTTFYAPLSVRDSAMLYRDGDVNIISVRPGIIKTALPLKTASALFAQKPIIYVGLETNLELWANNAHIYAVLDRDYTALAQLISTLAHAEKPVIEYNTHLFSKDAFIRDYTTIMNRYLR